MAEGASVHFLGEVAPHEFVLALWVLLMEELLEGPEYQKTLALVRHVRIELQDSLRVALTLSLRPGSGLWHLKPVINTREVHFAQSTMLLSAGGRAIHESEG